MKILTSVCPGVNDTKFAQYIYLNPVKFLNFMQVIVEFLLNYINPGTLMHDTTSGLRNVYKTRVRFLIFIKMHQKSPPELIFLSRTEV